MSFFLFSKLQWITKKNKFPVIRSFVNIFFLRIKKCIYKADLNTSAPFMEPDFTAAGFIKFYQLFQYFKFFLFNE